MVKVKHLLNIVTYSSVIVSYISVVKHLSIHYALAFIPLFILSAYLDYKRSVFIPRWVFSIASVLVVLASLSRTGADFLIEPILDALVSLIVIKLLESKQSRDYMQIYAICMLMLVGSSLISFSIIFMVYFSILLFLLTIALILLAHFFHDADMIVSHKAMVQITCSSLLICLLSIPSTSFFFIILPRTNFPLFTFLNRDAHTKSGFSDGIELGGVSEIQENNTVIFRAEMKKLLDANLYWRGIVLDEFDGRSWKSSKVIAETFISTMPGELVYQTIYLEPYGNQYLFSLDFPLRVSRHGVRQLSGMTFSMNEEISKRTKYTVTSVLSSILPDVVVDRQRFVKLPSFPSRRIAELVRELSANKSEPEKIQAFYDYLKLGNFKYSMENLPVSDNALEEFLFTNKHGNCEYFASALAVMLRMAGIPARLIGGYAGGYYNETGNYYMVLQKNAHVWVEVYVNDRGWVRLDPTPVSLQISHGNLAADVLMKLQLALDTFNYYWNRFIITYDFSRQIALFKKIRSSLSKPAVRLDMDPAVLGKYVACLLLFSSLFLVGLRASKHHRSNKNKLVIRFLSKMRQYGYDREKAEGLEEFVCRVSDESLRNRAYEFVTRFEAIYYKDGKFTKEDVRSLEKRIAEL
jgi:hypothetical protein